MDITLKIFLKLSSLAIVLLTHYKTQQKLTQRVYSVLQFYCIPS